jgi:metacaspase-1
MASTAMGLFKKVTQGDEVYQRNLRTKTSPADVIMWSGSKDTQTSADASIGGEATGAMSYAFISALKKNPQQSYVQLLNSIRSELEGKYDQKPQLSCSHPLGKSPASLIILLARACANSHGRCQHPLCHVNTRPGETNVVR